VGARAAVLVAGTAAAVRMALSSGRGFAPALVEAAPAARPALALAGAGTVGQSNPVDGLLRRLYLAFLIAAGGMMAIAALATGVTLVTRDASTSSGATAAPMHGPPASLRPASDAARGYEEAYAAALPPAGEVAGVLYAAAQEQHAWDVLKAMVSLNEQQKAAQSRVAASSVTRPAAGVPQTLNRPSGYPAGTVLRARITVYGCSGPGGGFCGGMASGVRVFEGAAACSHDLPFGTKLKIAGDPTGRVYECLDRGALSNTWVDVFFNNTSDGIRWASLLGGTTTEIEIVN
jgi:hypothetical protein